MEKSAANAQRISHSLPDRPRLLGMKLFPAAAIGLIMALSTPALNPALAKDLTLERLPAYAPDLNPVEAVWSWLKYGQLANFVPDGVGLDVYRAMATINGGEAVSAP